MKHILYFMAGVCLFYACSSTPEEREVTVSDVEITGTIKDFVKVVDGTYKFTNNGKEAFVTVQFELIEEPFGEVSLCIKNPNSIISVKVLDDSGNFIETGSSIFGFDAKYTEQKKLEDLLLTGKPGDKKRISFTWNYFGQDKKQGDLIFKKATSFEIQDDAFDYCGNDIELIENGMMEFPNNETETSSGSSNTKSENWDEMLSSYEKYVDQYIKYVKKINDGDMSAMVEYAKLLEKTTDLADKMEKAKGQLSSEQMKRYLDINNKFTKAIIDVAQ